MFKSLNSICKNTNHDDNLTFSNLYVPFNSYDNSLNLNQLNSIHSFSSFLNHAKNESYLEKKRFRTFDRYLNEETESELIYKAVKQVFYSNKEGEGKEGNITFKKSLQRNEQNIRKENINRIFGKNLFNNVLKKIQVHFITFIINLSNDAIKIALENKKDFFFIDIDYKIKSTINFNFFENLKSLKIKDIILNPNSKKFKLYPEDYNEMVYNEIINLSEWLQEFLNMDYLTLFEIYFNNGKQLNKIEFNGKEIILENKTKPFYELIKKYESPLVEIIINFTKTAYFGEKDAKKTIY